MSDAITAGQFHDFAGVEDWRVLLSAAQTQFRTGSFAAGLEFVDAIGALADAADHHPDIDLRYASVTVRLSSHDVHGLSRRDVALARQISTAARDLDLPADPSAVQALQVAIDALVGPDVQPFWRAVLDYREGPPQEPAPELSDPEGRAPSFWFQQMEAPRPQRNRIHLDVTVPHDVAEARVAAAIAAGGHLVSSDRAPALWVLADAEGNEACVCTWQAVSRESTDGVISHRP